MSSRKPIPPMVSPLMMMGSGGGSSRSPGFRNHLFSGEGAEYPGAVRKADEPGDAGPRDCVRSYFGVWALPSKSWYALT